MSEISTQEKMRLGLEQQAAPRFLNAPPPGAPADSSAPPAQADAPAPAPAPAPAAAAPKYTAMLELASSLQRRPMNTEEKMAAGLRGHMPRAGYAE